uniref:Uncharacterized protein n=1 Tax=Rhizophora mucronata TaxID=61149 RepID=A0A2P2QBM3_RHIMU
MKIPSSVVWLDLFQHRI